MWLLPTLQPGWFPLTAVDGSSTRALWTQLMGIVQCGVGVVFAVRHAGECVAAVRQVLARGAVATSQWEPDSVPAPVLAVEAARTEPAVPELAMAGAAVRGGFKASGAHPFAAALFRRHPKYSFVHLTQPRVGGSARIQHEQSDGLEKLREYLEEVARQSDVGRGSQQGA